MGPAPGPLWQLVAPTPGRGMIDAHELHWQAFLAWNASLIPVEVLA